MKKITSRDNPIFKRIRKAIDRHEDEIVVEGPKQVATAIENGWIPLLLVARDDSSPHNALCAPDAVHSPEFLSAHLFDSLAETKTSQGILAVFERPRTSLSDLLQATSPFIVALDHVQDPGNLGTIIRTASAFDVDGVVLLPGCADPFSSKAIRASAGAVLEMGIASANASDLLATNLPLFAADHKGKPLDILPSSNAILILGSEGQGVSKELLERSTLIRIATSGRVESLNVAIAAGILLSRSFDSRLTRTSR